MAYTKAAARKLAKRIQALHEEEHKPYRQIADEDFPGVAAGTLNRIALTGGEWMPKYPAILTALGLKKQKVPVDPHLQRTKKIIRRMVQQTNDAVIRRKR